MDWDSFDEEGAREDLGMRRCIACGSWCDGDLCGPSCEQEMHAREDEAQERFNQETEDERTDTTPREES